MCWSKIKYTYVDDHFGLSQVFLLTDLFLTSSLRGREDFSSKNGHLKLHVCFGESELLDFCCMQNQPITVQAD